MTYQVLARKWRPRKFGEMVGQTHVLKALTNALDSERLHHAYLFTGTRGVGKTTLARILAKCLNCEQGVSANPCGECSACRGIDEGRFVDLIEVDAASRAKVEETRDLMDNVQYSPTVGRYKVYLIDEVHMFSNHSFNALLKTLEEPPPHVKFLLATTEPKRLPVTILSRCLQFNLKHLSVAQIAQQVRSILNEEQIESDEESVALLAQAANGSMRDGLSLLDQAISHGGGKLAIDQVRAMLGTIDYGVLTGLLAAIISGDGEEILNRVNLLAEQNPDYDSILAELLSLLHNIATAQALAGADDLFSTEQREFAAALDPEEVQLYYQIALSGRRDLAISPDPRVGFEMTLIRMLAFKPDGGDNNRPASKPVKTAAIRPPQTPVITDAGDGDTAVAAADWQNIIDEMALAGLVKELAGHCVLKEHTADKVHLVLTPAQEHLLKTTQKDRLRDAIRTRFGPGMRLEITVEEPGAETPSAQRVREQKERELAAREAIKSDPNVQSMVEMFDGTVDEKSIRPVS